MPVREWKNFASHYIWSCWRVINEWTPKYDCIYVCIFFVISDMVLFMKVVKKKS